MELLEVDGRDVRPDPRRHHRGGRRLPPLLRVRTALNADDHRVVLERHPLPYRILIRAVTFVGAMFVLAWFKTLRVTVINGDREREWRKQHTMFYATFHRGVL